MGHRYGDSEQFYRAVKMVDNQMGRLREAIRYREANFPGEGWEIYITNDHGRDAATGKGHGGQSERERQTWIDTNASGLTRTIREHHQVFETIQPSCISCLKHLRPK